MRNLSVRAVLLVLAVPVGPATAQVFTAGTVSRYNPAYRVVPPRARLGDAPKMTIPIPLGLIQVLGDERIKDSHDSLYNPIRVVNYILNPPLYLEIKRAPTPTNDVELFIGRNELRIDLGESQALVPDEFGFATSQRLFNVGQSFRGFTVGVLAWVHTDAGIRMGDSLRAVLKEAEPALPQTRYSMTFDGLVQGGFAPQLGYAGRVWGDSARGVYAGAMVRYYVGSSYARAVGEAGFTTDTVLFGGANPLTEDGAGRTYMADPGATAGRGVGADLGVVYAAGPIEVGAGVTDLGATLTWSSTDVDSVEWVADTDELVETSLAENTETKTKLPVSTIVHGAYAFPTGTTVRAGVLRNTRGTLLSLGAEQRLGLVTARGALSRDQRDQVQFAWGGTLRLGPVGLNVDFFTHSRSLSEQRGITMASSLSIY